MGKKLNKAIKELDEMLDSGVEWSNQKLKKAHINLRKWLKELREYRKLKKKGRLLETPCAIGDTVFKINKGAESQIISMQVIGIAFRNKSLMMQIRNVNGRNRSFCSEKSFGHEVFLTRREAEKALARKEWEDA